MLSRVSPLRPITENAETIYVIDGPSAVARGGVWAFGIRKAEITRIRERATWVRLVQLLMIVSPGLITAERIFRGVKRPLCEGEDMTADEKKLTFTWKPVCDYDWEERHRFYADEIRQRAAPPGKVFVVTTTPNTNRTAYPSIDCWINRWNWVEESLTLAEAPVDHETRYTERLK